MIEALSVAVPGNLLDRSRLPAAAVESFERVTGIRKTRRWSGSSIDLALEAVKALGEQIAESGVSAVVLVTQSPDRLSPCMALDVVRALRLPADIPVFDVNQSCTGFVYGHWLGTLVCRDGLPALVVCVDRLRTADESSVESLIFSDGACAALVSRDRVVSFSSHYGSRFHNDPTGIPELGAGRDGVLTMNGSAVFDFVTRNIPGQIREFEKHFGPAEILAQHQPNLSMMRMVERRAGFDGRALQCVEEYGNMSMVSVAAALVHGEERVLGKRVLMVGYGAGWSSALGVIHWRTERVGGVVEV